MYVPRLDLTWENEENYGKQMFVHGLQYNTTLFVSNPILNAGGKKQIIFPDPRIKINELTCEVTETVGQKRILLRQVTPYALSQSLDVNLIPNITYEGSSVNGGVKIPNSGVIYSPVHLKLSQNYPISLCESLINLISSIRFSFCLSFDNFHP